MIARFYYRPMLTAAIGTIHDLVGRGGDNACRVARYGGALLGRTGGANPIGSGRVGHRRKLRERGWNNYGHDAPPLPQPAKKGDSVEPPSRIRLLTMVCSGPPIRQVIYARGRRREQEEPRKARAAV